LSWNSSRLEGNTYSLLDTKHLIDFGQEAAGKQQLEAQMILNHKDAIEFLVGSAEDIGFNRYTFLNLHALLANNLLGDPGAAGRLRRIPIGIERSSFHPLEVPQLIEESFDQILATAGAIADPFEQAFFMMVQMPYLQPFDDVNKRVSRLAANIPLIKANLAPLSYAEVPRSTYTDAMLGVYELNKIDLLKDVFIWAYERSAARYVSVRQSLGEPDPFRLRHRSALREIVADVVRQRIGRKVALTHIAAWTRDHIDVDDRDRFQETAETELLGLHEGNFARYQIRPSEFREWQLVWTPTG
jgi:fido (protein-threonine AMPylation protein)